MRRCAFLVCVVLLSLAGVSLGQVIPPGTASGGPSGSLPATLCVNTVGVGLTEAGVLQCAPVTPAMTTGLVPAGQDVNTTGQVIATHLQGPLPTVQGGLGLASGPAGGLLFFTDPTHVAVTGALAQNAPLLGGGAGAGPVTGSRSGTTLEFGTIQGTKTPNKQLTFDANGNIIASASDTGTTGGVVSVFGRTGAVIAAPGDYTAAQVTNAASLLTANVFTHPSGQAMAQLLLLGSTAGTLALRAPAGAGTSLIVWPAGTTDFSASGGPSQVVRQSTVGGALNVGQLSLSDILGTGALCSTASVCTGYQAAIAYTTENVANKSTSAALGASDTLYPTQAAVKTYVDTGLATKQASLGFTAENLANKSTNVALGASDTLYSSQNAVKTYVDTGLATKQASLGFTAENVANKSTDVALGASATLYPSQGAVKSYVDTALAAKQATITWGAGLAATGATASVDSTETGFLANGVATPLTCGPGTAGRMQVLASGDLQYCDGASPAVLHTGTLTPTGLTWQVVAASCTGDANGGKLTVIAGGQIVCASDIGGAGGPGLTSVFGRTGAVVANAGDYSAAQVTNAADLTAANTFPHASGQSMARLVLLGSSSGTLIHRAPAAAGSNTLVWPAGSTDFSATGGVSQVVRQSSAGGAFTVSQLTMTDLVNGSTICTTSGVCTGYQAALGFTAENVANKSTAVGLGTSDTLYPSQAAVKSYVDTGLATKQASLGFTAENVANKATSTSLGTSDTLYPSQNAVKSYVDTGLAAKQATITWGAGLAATGAVARVDSTEAGFLTNGAATPLTCGAAASGKMQVLNTGPLQYCDGAGTSGLQSGFLTQSGLSWNVTLSTCTSDGNAGKLTVNGSGQIVCAADQGSATLAFSAITAGTLTSQALVVGNSATLAPTGTGTLTANLLTGAPTIGSGSSLGPTGTGTITANALTGTLAIGSGASLAPSGSGTVTANLLVGNPTIGSGATLGPTGTGVLTANALTGAIVLPSGSSLSATGTGAITATALTGIADLTALLTTTNTKKVTNKQHVARVVALAASGSPLTVSPAPDCDAGDIFTLNAIAADLTIPAPTCTGSNPEPEQEIEFRLFSAAPRALTLNAAYCALDGPTLPTGTTGDGVHYDRFKFRRNSVAACWSLIATTQGLQRGVTTLASSTTFTCDPRIAERCEMQMTGGAGTVTMDDSLLMTPTPANGTYVWLALQCTSLQTIAWDAGIIDGVYQTRPLSCPANTNIWVEVLLRYSTVESKWIVLVGASATGAPTFTVTKNLPVTGVKLPATNPARIDRSGETDKLLFDGVTAQCVAWQFMWPSDYASGGTIKLNGSMASDTTTSHSVKYDFSVWKVTPGAAVSVDTVSYDSVNACNTAAIPGTIHFPFTVSCALTNKDGVAAGDNVLLKMCRDTATDTATGDGEVGFVELSYVH